MLTKTQTERQREREKGFSLHRMPTLFMEVELENHHTKTLDLNVHNRFICNFQKLEITQKSVKGK